MKIIIIGLLSAFAVSAGIFDDVEAIEALSKIYGITAEEAQALHVAANKARKEQVEKQLTYPEEADLARLLRATGKLPDVRSKFRTAPAEVQAPSPFEEQKQGSEDARKAKEKEARLRAELELQRKEAAESKKKKAQDAIAELRARSEAELKVLTNSLPRK